MAGEGNEGDGQKIMEMAGGEKSVMAFDSISSSYS